MKNSTLLFIAIASVFFSSVFGQSKDRVSAITKLENVQLMSTNRANDDLVVSYHVEERRNTNLGSHITTYNVPSLSLISTNDLGPSNTRIVTPKYGKVKAIAITVQATAVVMKAELPKSSLNLRTPVQTKAEAVAPAKKEVYAYINVTDTYERILNKGYKSVEMFERVANTRFFDGELATAAKWYKELFAATTDLQDVYYYRYAHALKSIGEIKKANEMMAIFESKISKNP